MKYCELLLEKNYSAGLEKSIRKKIKLRNYRLYYPIKTDVFGGDQIYEMLCVIQYIKKTYGQKIPITFILGEVEFYDKLVYIILESIVYYMFKNEKHDMNLESRVKHSIYTEGIRYSPLKFIKYKEEYQRKFKSDIGLTHFRRLISSQEQKKEEYLSDLMQQIYCFLWNNGVSADTSDQLAEVLVELVGNAGEHGKSDCLLDVDITQTAYTREEVDGSYYGMNAVVLNYSPTLFFDRLRQKLDEQINPSERYTYVLNAKKYHLQNLTENYFEDDFYTVSSFQHKISGDIDKNSVGGTGLTGLLQSLEEQSNTHLCYMLSGNRIFFFEKEFMGYNQDKFIGFNRQQNYLTEVPEKELFMTIETFLPGVAYNLNYAIKKEWENEQSKFGVR